MFVRIFFASKRRRPQLIRVKDGLAQAGRNYLQANTYAVSELHQPEWLARRICWLPLFPPTDASRSFYGVGAGDSAGDGEASVDPSVFGGVFFAALCFRGGVGVGLAAAGAVVVAVVPCCCVQEATNATPIKALIKHNTYFFIGC